MDNVDRYRQVFNAFKELCALGKQSCSFASFCRKHGVVSEYMPSVLNDEYLHVKTLPGYMCARDVGFVCYDIYKQFKALCAEGKQPGTFRSFYRNFGITKKQMDGFMNRTQLKICEIPGFSRSCGHKARAPQIDETPFEEILLKESGFIPSNSNDVITVNLENHMSVSFPSHTDISVVIDFVKRIGKEVYHVGA